ncbi:efflux RND transporter periplasmic adaptor subunit, partial [Pseudomonas viridiflava]|uniref:efflux RND transporter periplasmic adaptor subunit n=1 Tax=Pseudomonas viridiflava TaxID=33069 RepID=UPI00197F5A5F
TKVLETDIANLKIGQKADIIPISGNSKFAATITDINPLVDENGLVNVRLKILNTNGLLPGMNATCSIHVPSSLCIAVPKQAVIMRNGKAVIFTIEGGQAKWNYVVLGKDNGLEVEVKDGLKVGQKAIISNNVQLSNGALVKEDI